MSFVKVKPKSRHSRRSEAPARFHVSETDLLCKNSCGFYGNVHWDGYCSKCFRETGTAAKLRHRPLDFLEKTKSKVSRSVSDVGESMKTTLQSAKSNLPALPRIDERRKMSSGSGKSGAPRLFKKSPSKDSQRASSPESHRMMQDFNRFLKSHSSQADQEMNLYAKKSLEKIEHTLVDEHLDGEELSNMFKEIYQNFKDKAEKHQAFQGIGSEDIEILLDHLERYLCTRLYRKLTYNGFSVEEDKDLLLQKRIRQMNWITPEMLDCSINEKSQNVQKLFEAAISNLIEIDSKRVPQDKLQLVVNTSQRVFEILKESSENPNDSVMAADDFLPTLIYVVLRANPPRLWSNITYITHFANPSRSESGESGYYFTNLRIAIEFIEKMCGKDLDLSDEQFESYMSGELFPLSALQNGRYEPEGLQITSSNLEILTDLQKKREEINAKADAIEKELIDFEQDISDQVDGVLRQYPLNLRGPKVDISLDDSPTVSDLPPPLLPTFVGPQTSTLSQFDEAFFVGGKKIPIIPCEAQAPLDSRGIMDEFGSLI